MRQPFAGADRGKWTKMERQELQARLRELNSRAQRRGMVGCTGFLTPAEQQWALADSRQAGLDGLVLWGGPPQSERKMAFFFPDWADPEDYPYDEAAGVHLTARFGAPTHRDVLGAVLSLGVERHAVGDIAVMGEEAWFIALAPVARLAAQSLERVGRAGVRAELTPWQSVPVPVVETRPVRFTVQSLRLDAAVSGLFRLSRTEAQNAVAAGRVSLNHLECQRADARVAADDVIALRGEGKGRICTCDSLTRKGRVAVEAERWV